MSDDRLGRLAVMSATSAPQRLASPATNPSSGPSMNPFQISGTCSSFDWRGSHEPLWLWSSDYASCSSRSPSDSSSTAESPSFATTGATPFGPQARMDAIRQQTAFPSGGLSA